MKTEQARALKIGDGIVLSNASQWDDMTVGKSYPVIKVANGAVHITDDVGDTRSWRFNSSPHDFDLPPASTSTQWIPFDKERMSEAEGYRHKKFGNYEVTQVNLYEVHGGDKITALSNKTLEVLLAFDIEMLVPVVVKYPCVCWVSDKCKAPSEELGCSKVIINKLRASGWHEEDMSAWKYATPLTTTELAEIGLKQIS